MSFVQATPEFVAAAATDLARIGSTISSANTAALGPTSGVLAPGADEVSASIAALFDAHSQVYQALSAQAAAFHSQFVQLMNGGALQYAVTEAANTTPLQ
ncbi:PE family protein, partial [Mycobacterium avium]